MHGWDAYGLDQCILGSRNINDTIRYFMESASDHDPDLCRTVVYCETFLQVPERYSAFSALFISLMAIYQFSWDHPISIYRLFAACIFFNGIFSFLNHWTGSLVFSFLDNATMYVPLNIFVAVALTRLLNIGFQIYYLKHNYSTKQRFNTSAKDNKYTDHNCKHTDKTLKNAKDLSCLQFEIMRCLRMSATTIIYITCVAVMGLNLWNDATLNNSTMFVITFAVPLLIMTVIAVVIRRSNHVTLFALERFGRAARQQIKRKYFMKQHGTNINNRNNNNNNNSSNNNGHQWMIEIPPTRSASVSQIYPPNTQVLAHRKAPEVSRSPSQSVTRPHRGSVDHENVITDFSEFYIPKTSAIEYAEQSVEPKTGSTAKSQQIVDILSTAASHSKHKVQTQLRPRADADDLFEGFLARSTVPVYVEILSIIAEEYFCRGLVISIICAIVWIIVENICVYYQWMKYLQCHLIWHIGMSYGLSHLTFYFLFVQCMASGHEVYFTNWLHWPCVSTCTCSDRRDVWNMVRKEIQNEISKVINFDNNDKDTETNNDDNDDDEKSQGSVSSSSESKSRMKIKRKYLISQKKVEKICRRLSMWKFVFPQINVIDPIFTTSDDLDNMFELWCEDDILTQVEVIACKDRLFDFMPIGQTRESKSPMQSKANSPDPKLTTNENINTYGKSDKSCIVTENGRISKCIDVIKELQEQNESNSNIAEVIAIARKQFSAEISSHTAMEDQDLPPNELAMTSNDSAPL